VKKKFDKYASIRQVVRILAENGVPRPGHGGVRAPVPGLNRPRGDGALPAGGAVQDPGARGVEEMK
jgi:hypothetical protein